MSLHNINECLTGLSSSKLSERRKGAQRLADCLQDKKITRLLDNSENELTSWTRILMFVHDFLSQEADKLAEDESKNRKSTLSNTFFNQKELILTVVRKASRNSLTLSGVKVVDCILKCFNSQHMRKYFGDTYITILKDFLMKPRYMGNISANHWLSLLRHLKSFHLNAKDDTRILECLQLLFKEGPLHGLPITKFRQEYMFVTELIKDIKPTHKRGYQETALKLLLDFCIQTAKDNRLSCCKLGEEVIGSLLHLFENEAYDTVVVILYKFFLLQVKLHHPKGSSEHSIAAYANNWPKWKRSLKHLYSIISKEITKRLKKMRSVHLNFGTKQDVKESLDKNLCLLAIEVFKQIQSFSSEADHDCSGSSSEITQPASKRIKTDIGITSVIDNIQSTKSWPWIEFVGKLLEKYPKLITPDDFLSLLQTLTALQAQCRETSVLCHLHKCLSILIDVQVQLQDLDLIKDRLQALWKDVWEMAHRTAGLNQNIQHTHELLQKLITLEDNLPHLILFNTYSSGVLIVNKYSLSTLNTLCSYLSIPDKSPNYTNIRQNLLSWILSTKNDKCPDIGVFSEKITAKVLVSLTMKEWPEKFSTAIEKPYNVFNDIEDIYCITSLQGELIFDQKNSVKESTDNKETKKYLKDDHIMTKLHELIKDYSSQFLESETKNFSILLKDLLNFIILISNILSEMLNYDILDAQQLKEHVFIKILNEMLNLFTVVFKKHSKNIGEQDLIIFKLMIKLFQIEGKEILIKAISNLVPDELVKAMFSYLNEDNEKKKDDDTKTDSDKRIELQRNCQLALCSYFCNPNLSDLNDLQLKALTTFINYQFELKESNDFSMAVLLLKSLVRCKVGVIPDDNLEDIFQCLTNMCKLYYTETNTALELLELWLGLYPHVINSNSETLKVIAAKLLEPFYENCSIYGPFVHVTLIHCMGQVVKWNPTFLWSGDAVANKIFMCLKSDFQEVRLAAIKNITFLFKQNEVFDKSYMEQQKNKFKIICCKLEEIFEIEEELEEDSKIDETVTRTATVLLAFLELISQSTIWRKEALFHLLKLIYHKKMSSDYVSNALNIVSRSLGFKNSESFLKPYVDFLIRRWHNENLPLDSFPFDLLGCATITEYYNKYLLTIGPVLISCEKKEILKNISVFTGRSVDNIFQECFPSVLAIYLYGCIRKEERYSIVKCYENIQNTFGAEVLNEWVLDKIDTVIVNILECTYDFYYLRERFLLECPLPEPSTPSYSVNETKNCIQLLEEKFLNLQSIIAVCGNQFPDKLQKILLHLKVGIHSTPDVEDKIIVFLQYILFVDLLLAHFSDVKRLKEYLIQDITRSLLCLLVNKDEKDCLRILSCKYLKIFISQLLPEYSDLFSPLLVTIVSRLVSLAKHDNSTGNECMKFLHILIVDNCAKLKDGIEMLDPFPEEDRFKSLREIYNKIKYSSKDFILEVDIRNFLSVGEQVDDMDGRFEGLRYLKKQLSEKKEELKGIYAKLHQLRGFSEDCNSSILHRLICSLLKLSKASNPEVSNEATSCLGELGPANLTTMILEVQEKYEKLEYDYNIFLAGYIISLLANYIFDDNIEVLQAASNAFYIVLEFEDAKSALKSEGDFGFGKIKRSHVEPFVKTGKGKSCKYSLNVDYFNSLINNIELWCPTYTQDHFEWVTKLVCALLCCFDKSYLKELVEMCKVKIDFAESILPLLIVLILSNNKPNCNSALSHQINNFFEKHWIISLKDTPNDKDIAMNKNSLRCLLDVVYFVRFQRNFYNNMQSQNELSLNYLYIAKAAHFCGEYFAAQQYVELWSQERLSEIRSSVSSFSSNDTPLYVIMLNETAEVQEVLQTILKEGYKKIGDSDALYGCRSNYFFDPKKEIDDFEQMQKWDDIILQYDVQISHGGKHLIPDFLGALKQCSLYSTSLNYEQSQYQQYECAWRLSNWNITQTYKRHKEIGCNFEKERYFAIKALHENDVSNFRITIKKARENCIDELKSLSIVSCKNIYKLLGQFQSLEELQQFEMAKRENKIEQFVGKWSLQDTINTNDFQYMEPIQAQRIVLLKDVIQNEKQNLQNILVELHLKLAEAARKEGFYSVASRTINELKYIKDLNMQMKCHIMLEESQLWWEKDKSIAKSKLKFLLSMVEEFPRLYANVLKLYGSWMIETRSESSRTIISQYFLKSISVLRGTENTVKDQEDLCDTYDILARYCDSQYQEVLAYIKSSEFQRKIHNMEKSRNTAMEIIQKSKGKSALPDERRALTLHEKQSKIDQNEIQSTYKEKQLYLDMALKYYILNLQKSLSNDLRMFRIFSLWLDNKNNTDIMQLMSSGLPTIPSYKYIPILPQLAPHVNINEDDVFGQLVCQLIERCAVDHPHHTLPILLALAYSNLDKKYLKSGLHTNANESRVYSASTLVKKLKRRGPNLENLIEKMEYLLKALVELAYLAESECKRLRSNNTQMVIRDSCLIRKIKNFDDVLLPTCNLAVNRNNNYPNIIGIRSFDECFCFVGGINAPKQITCVGTDGIRRTQLVKGQDDLRQDAVMQQVFNIMNQLLASNKHAAEQKLCIKTYKIVPLSQRSGILEWVENSIPMGDYLNKAHQRYHKNDYSPTKCRNEIRSAAKLTNEEKLQVFERICKNFQPVFHKFFEESFLQPSVWYERRQAYMHSVATSSMCGYILGIGDRHVQNILIHKQTAEVIHIDFGIAFEQGRILPTPETVPFRLTRDIEAGMGICGIEGVFRRSCEKTMDVLRNNAETIITILEVLLYDPLYAWTVTPKQAYSRQFSSDSDESSPSPTASTDQDNDTVNAMAERALLRLRQKLKGTEEGNSTSIEGQVEKLIQQARDPTNLSRLFCGWQAYL